MKLLSQLAIIAVVCCLFTIAYFLERTPVKEVTFTDFEKKLMTQIDKRDSLINILIKNELVMSTALETATSSFPEQHLPENNDNDVLTHFVFKDINGKPHKFHVYIPKGK